jgi:hypothetical protein
MHQIFDIHRETLVELRDGGDVTRRLERELDLETSRLEV